MNKTLFKYIFTVQLKAMLFVSFFLFGLIFIFDFAEVVRKFPISSLEETFYAFRLSFLKVPITFCSILCYAYFITAALSLWNLCVSNQITVMKSIGKSPQQILFPFITFAIFLAVIWLFCAHPLGQLSQKYYEKYASKNEILKNDINENIWIDYGNENQIIFIKKICDNYIEGIYIFDILKGQKTFAKKGIVNNEGLIIEDVSVVFNDSNIKKLGSVILKKHIPSNLLTLLSKVPQKQNIYRLYSVYDIEKETKANLKTYELELHKLIATCVSFILFSIFSAVICFPINRYKSRTNIALKVISFAILLRFSNSLFESLAYSGVLSVTLAAWSATIIFFCLSVAALIWKEA